MIILRINLQLAGLSLLLLLVSCADRYPYFIQKPEFETSQVYSQSGALQPGIKLAIVCADEHAIIRYTLDGSEPSESHGQLYSAPLYLVSNKVTVKAVAVREGFDAGPTAEYYYDPDK